MADQGITLRELDGRPVTVLNGVGEARARSLAAMEVRSVSTRVNSVRNDGPGCIELDRLPLFADRSETPAD